VRIRRVAYLSELQYDVICSMLTTGTVYDEGVIVASEVTQSRESFVVKSRPAVLTH
jgi:hypothetical protein